MPRMEQIERDIIEEFEYLCEPLERYEYLIDIGKKMNDFDEKLRTEQNIVKGCQSTVWLAGALQADGTMHYQADSNTVITKGIIALLLRVLNGQTPDIVQTAPLNFIDAIDLRSHLSAQRSNGLNAMVQRIRQIAAQAQSSKPPLS